MAHTAAERKPRAGRGSKYPYTAKHGGFDHNLHQVQRLYILTIMFKIWKGGCGDDPVAKASAVQT